MRFPAVLAVLSLVGAAHGEAEADLASVFLELERSVEVDDVRSVEDAKARLAEVRADWWEQLLPPGDLRGALALSLPRSEVIGLLRQAGRRPGRRRERVATLAENLASRGDLVGILLEEGVFGDLIPTHRRLLFDLAEVALVEGDPGPALALLRDPGAARKTAEDLSGMTWSEGPRLLADVVTGRHTVPAAALARVALAEPDVHNVYYERPLGSERVAALLDVARSAPDPALRAVAARLLLRSCAAGSFPAVVAAYREARSVHLEADGEWWRIGRIHDRLVTDPLVSRRARIEALRGVAQFSGLSPANDAREAEAVADALRGWLASAEDPLLRGLLIREIEPLRWHFVDEHGRRKRAVPSYTALLRDLERGRVADTPALRDLGRRIARRLLVDLAREPAPHWRRKERLPKREVALPEPLRALDLPDLAHLAAGVDRDAERRALLADHAEAAFEGAVERTSGEPDEATLELDDECMRGLLRTLAEDPDPNLVLLAGRILDRTRTKGAYEALLDHVDRFRDAGGSPRIPGLARHLRSIPALEVLLSFLTDTGRSPWLREDLAEELLGLEWLQSLPAAERDAALDAVEAWIRSRAPKLDGGLAEVVLTVWADLARDPLWESRAARMEKILRAAIEDVPVEGPRLRLRADLLGDG